VEQDFSGAQKDSLVKKHGFQTQSYHE